MDFRVARRALAMGVVLAAPVLALAQTSDDATAPQVANESVETERAAPQAAQPAPVDLSAPMPAAPDATEKALANQPDVVLIDGDRVPPDLGCRAETIVGGDAQSYSIAAASILAKVTRDRYMHGLATSFPGYGWETNVGYNTAEHLAALNRLGPTPHHRRSFAPVTRLLEPELFESMSHD